MIDFELTDEQRLIQETARDFADNEIAPRARDNDRSSTFDTEIVAKMAEMGFIGPILPEEYGGRGIDYRTYGLIVEEIGRADSSARTVVSVNTSLVGSVIAKFGTEEQKRQHIPGICSGEALGCFGLTEPDTGSDAANLSLDGVEVAEDAVLGEVGQGFKVAMTALDSGRFSVAAGCVGICQG